MRKWLTTGVAAVILGLSLAASALTFTVTGTAADGTQTTTSFSGPDFTFQLQYPDTAKVVQILPGNGYATISGSVYSVDANGFIYHDGVKMVNSGGTATAVQQLNLYGLSVFGMGKTDGKWWRWTGAGWTGTADVDPAALTVAPVPVPPVVVAPPSPPTPPEPAGTWAKIADEHQTVTVAPNTTVRWGLSGSWVTQVMSGTFVAENATFGSDPAPGLGKEVDAFTPAVTP